MQRWRFIRYATLTPGALGSAGLAPAQEPAKKDTAANPSAGRSQREVASRLRTILAKKAQPLSRCGRAGQECNGRGCACGQLRD